ncbi:MAG: aspartate/glutamate racemase [Thermobacillus sp. ZCTH02-B1]|uniref:aspartate/glutamate racemase family protein n=1 Tax=Thermobacillus sp. ZCTH02-B1 TaxID=1858795 RepID=UPI000B57EAD6|nr:aspartate/glutamate racemase family protein [Thermobacillus sp. ZCTH02-B1]OUM93791.1 MAG: aspartate/glutamate racemase [Thermobacillus sp. ZCTH02-B1]
MKTIGLLGGMSWQSTIEYYRILNEEVASRLGGLHSAKIVMYSVDFDGIAEMQRRGDWMTAGRVLAEAAQGLERAGADMVLICANTMHIVADAVQQAVRIPLVHLADVTAARVKRAGLTRVGLLGTRYTMEKDFLKDRLASHGLTVHVPEAEDREEVHRIIYEDLCRGIITEESRRRVKDVAERLAARGAEGILLGCTELPLLIRPGDLSVPEFDTTRIHAETAVEMALCE